MRAIQTIAGKGKIGGQRRAPFPDWPVARPARDPAGPLTLRALRTAVGRAAGAAFPQRQEARHLGCFRRVPDPGPSRPAHLVPPQPDRPARRRGGLIP